MLKKIHVLAALVLIAVLGLSAAGCRALAPAIQYTPLIDWQGYEAGLARAAAERKPILLTFGADWCGPCKVMARAVFADPRVIERAKDFVVIHVNGDKREDLTKKFRVHGYPATFFLTAEGQVIEGVRAPWTCNAHGYDAREPASLLGGMAAAIKLSSDPTATPERVAIPPAYAAQLCASHTGDAVCFACIKAHCCAELMACLDDSPACVCAKPSHGAADASLTACLQRECTQCPLLKPPAEGSPP